MGFGGVFSLSRLLKIKAQCVDVQQIIKIPIMRNTRKYHFKKIYSIYLGGVGIIGVVGLLHFCPLSQLAVISIPITLTVGDCSVVSNSSPSLLGDSWPAVSSCKSNS